jgi:hypothetical protein
MRAPQILIIVMIVIIVSLLEGTLIDASGLFHVCFERTGDGAGSKLSFTISIAALLTCLALLSVFDLSAPLHSLTTRRFVRWHPKSMFLLAYTGLWWLGTYMSAHVIDMIINDRLCSRHESLNGISGHLTFFSFWVLTLAWFVRYNTANVTKHDVEHFFDPRLYLHALRSRTLLSVLTAVYLAFATMSAAVVSHTWLGGYHSLRQMLIGALLACGSHWTLGNVFDNLLLAPRERRERVRSVLAALVGVFVALSWSFEVRVA